MPHDPLDQANQTTVLVVEDDPTVLETISICFSLQWPHAQVVTAESGEKALDLAQLELPDLVILDINLPGISGYETLRRLREFSDVPVLVLTARDSDVDKVRGLELGADDYVTKPFSHIELLARLRAILRRTRRGSSGSDEFVYRNEAAGLEIDFGSRSVTRHGQPINLAPLEYFLLYHLVNNEGKILPRETILAKVWGREYLNEVEYLKVYVRRLRSKLGDSPQDPELIHTVRGVGYMFQVKPKTPTPAQTKG